MSLITRRALSTLLPPRIASTTAAQPKRKVQGYIDEVTELYEGLPKGPAPKAQPKGLFQRYQHRYFGENESPAPIFHVIGVLLVFGYAQDYYFHLRHHKQNAH